MRRQVIIKFDWANVVVAVCLVLALIIPVFLIDIFLPNFFVAWNVAGATYLGWVWAIYSSLKFLIESNNKN